jgi:4,5-dihydroxyphthalate decarboxylase
VLPLNAKLHLTLACENYDRTYALQTGEVSVEGVDLNYLRLPVEETFFRMVSHQEFDVSELSLSTYVMTLQMDPPPFVAIPVFPSRAFRHSGVYVNTAAGIQSAEQLKGRQVGVAEYQLTAAVWIRGILAEHHGLPVESVHYRTGGMHTSGRIEKFPVSTPPEVDVSPIPEGQTLSDMLVTGEIDALYSPRTPRPFAEGRPEVARLFPDSARIEQAYYETTQIFPIMHVVVVRREIYDAHPWVARSLQKAFELSRIAAMTGIDETASLRYMLPWVHDEVARTRQIMGEDYWSYGLDGNEKALQTFLGYSYDQGLADRLWSPDELFAVECRDAFVI